MKIPFFSTSGEQPAWQPATDDYVRFRPESPLPSLLEPFRNAIGIITRLEKPYGFAKDEKAGLYVSVAFIPEDAELDDITSEADDIRRIFHLKAECLEKAESVDQDTVDLFDAIAERLAGEPDDDDDDDPAEPDEPEPTPPSPEPPPLPPAPSMALPVPEEPVTTKAVAR